MENKEGYVEVTKLLQPVSAEATWLKNPRSCYKVESVDDDLVSE